MVWTKVSRASHVALPLAVGPACEALPWRRKRRCTCGGKWEKLVL
jgi:hypothetical protein